MTNIIKESTLAANPGTVACVVTHMRGQAFAYDMPVIVWRDHGNYCTPILLIEPDWETESGHVAIYSGGSLYIVCSYYDGEQNAFASRDEFIRWVLAGVEVEEFYDNGTLVPISGRKPYEDAPAPISGRKLYEEVK